MVTKHGEFFRFITSGKDLRCTTVSLTNAQILALPSTDVQIVAAPGAGRMILPLFAEVRVIATAGAYGGVDAAAFIYFQINGIDMLGFVVNDAGLATPATGVTSLLTNASVNAAWTVPLMQPDDTASAWWTLAKVHVGLTTLQNQALLIGAENGGASPGNPFTGGNAANSAAVTVFHLVL